MRAFELRRRAWIHAALALAVGERQLAAQNEQIGKLSLSAAAACFADLAEASARDGGELWGVPIGGPVLLVDPVTRKVVGNQADTQGLLVAKSGVFVGTLAREKPIANAPVEWAGRRWAMAQVIFLGETKAERVALLAHESFHCVQKDLGLYVFGEECAHLDAPEGRLWLQLEWNALQEALAAEGEARLVATRDALDFRAARRTHFPEAAARENALELREGLASYTGNRLAGRAPAEVVADVVARRAREENFTRSFAYSSGPLYGYLLDAANATWRKSLDGASDLGAALAAAMGYAPDPARAEMRAGSYGGDALRATETERERARQERLAGWRRTLVDGPVLVLDLAQVATGTMDTRKVFPFDEGRAVYTERKLVARFGTLELSGGAILEDTKARLGRISLLDAAPDHLSGPGWSLELAQGWSVEPGERAGDFVVRKAP